MVGRAGTYRPQRKRYEQLTSHHFEKIPRIIQLNGGKVYILLAVGGDLVSHGREDIASGREASAHITSLSRKMDAVCRSASLSLLKKF